jgi:hypothetical protein
MENWAVKSARDLKALVRMTQIAESEGIDAVMHREHIVLGPSAGAAADWSMRGHTDARRNRVGESKASNLQGFFSMLWCSPARLRPARPLPIGRRSTAGPAAAIDGSAPAAMVIRWNPRALATLSVARAKRLVQMARRPRRTDFALRLLPT